MKKYTPNKKNTQLFDLMEDLHNHKEELDYRTIRNKSNRLTHIEHNARQIEQIAIKIQEQIKTMRRK